MSYPVSDYHSGPGRSRWYFDNTGQARRVYDTTPYPSAQLLEAIDWFLSNQPTQYQPQPHEAPPPKARSDDR